MPTTFCNHVDNVQIEGKLQYVLQLTMKFLSASAAAALDKDLMSTGAFSIDQSYPLPTPPRSLPANQTLRLMELAGLSVSQALYRLHPIQNGKRILVICGPGNNGGDGMVAARHLYVPPSLTACRRRNCMLHGG